MLIVADVSNVAEVIDALISRPIMNFDKLIRPSSLPARATTRVHDIGIKLSPEINPSEGDLKGPHSTPLHSRPYNDTERLRQHSMQQFSSSLIASGGISSIDDLRSIAALGIEGAIVGKALYTGDVDLVAAIQEFER